MPIFKHGDDGLKFMQWLNSSKSERGSVRISAEDGYQPVMRQIEETLDRLLTGEFLVLLGREDAEHFTDAHVEFVVRYQADADQEHVQKVLKSFAPKGKKKLQSQTVPAAEAAAHLKAEEKPKPAKPRKRKKPDA